MEGCGAGVEQYLRERRRNGNMIIGAVCVAAEIVCSTTDNGIA